MPEETNNDDQGGSGAASLEYLEALLSQYRDEQGSVPERWRRYFSEDRSELAPAGGTGASPFVPSSVFNPPAITGAELNGGAGSQRLQHRFDQFLHTLRSEGHRFATLDPLGLADADREPLDRQRRRLDEAGEQPTVCYRVSDSGELRRVPIGELARRLTRVYCGPIGYEFAHLRDAEARNWLQERIEAAGDGEPLSAETQLRILRQLSRATTFERFVRKKHLGAKTFSLEGAETLIPLLNLALEHAAGQGVAEVVIGMAHRGRLNVLANIVGKPAVEIFAEFQDRHPDWWRGRGDVRHHLGASGDWRASDGSQVHVSLCFNPSHLEFINPIAQGRVRAKQDRAGDHERKTGVTFLIHGDAGFAGEGIVQESLNLGGLPAYRTGGTLHIVVNNQIGFTTAPSEGRSTEYATDIARSYSLPIFHVNGDFPLEVARVVELAMDFRARFARDVVIDLYCCRRWGHNEADEPSFTQPLMYERIDNREPIYDRFLRQLVEDDLTTRDDAERIEDEDRSLLEEQHAEAKRPTTQPHLPPRSGVWSAYCCGDAGEEDFETGVPAPRLVELLERITTFPDGFHLHKKLRRSVEQRQEMAQQQAPIDWSTAEALAFASLAADGAPVRLSGQDSGRGTFSQRHALLHDVSNGRRINIFDNLSDEQAEVEIVNSPLCEAGALGFEYGYSLDHPAALVLWEAQFGDFVNAGQVIIDQFIASADDKWRRLSGLVLLLPHGFEGQGPEHSSARLERLLAMSAEDNIQTACPSTPAQYFHLLRRQVKRPWRKPLFVLTHKSLLRHTRMASSLEDLGGSCFRRILGDDQAPVKATSRVLLASGKMAFDLLEERDKREGTGVAILRVEQFYPLGDNLLAEALSPYRDGTPVVWVQEEPENMGAWPYWKQRFCDRIVGRFPFSVVARAPSASPATGSSAAHKLEQKELIAQAFNSQ